MPAELILPREMTHFDFDNYEDISFNLQKFI